MKQDIEEIVLDEHGCLTIRTPNSLTHFFLEQKDIDRLREEVENYVGN